MTKREERYNECEHSYYPVSATDALQNATDDNIRLQQRRNDALGPENNACLFQINLISFQPVYPMGSFINTSSILVLLLALVNCVSAETYYIGPTIGGILGVVSDASEGNHGHSDDLPFRSFSFWISSLPLKSSDRENLWSRNCSGFCLLSSSPLSVSERRCHLRRCLASLSSRFGRLFTLWPSSISRYLNQHTQTRSAMYASHERTAMKLCYVSPLVFLALSRHLLNRAHFRMNKRDTCGT